MKKQLIVGFLAGAFATAAGVSLADERGAPDWTDVEQFAVLPDGVRFPEGITANPATGEIYAGTFDFGPNANNPRAGAPAKFLWEVPAETRTLTYPVEFTNIPLP